MILKSLKNDKQYFWIKVPRTATYSFKEFFKRYNTLEEDKHYHHSYHELCNMNNVQLPAVSMVRHPLNKFKSAIYYLIDKHINTTSEASQLWESTESCIHFLNSSFGRNCSPKGVNVGTIFIDEDISRSLPNVGTAFFRTQTEYVYHPKVTIFKYEEINEFINWIDEFLGYDVNTIPRINSSCKHINVNVDFEHPELIKTIENLYYIDYKIFKYPLQYLL